MSKAREDLEAIVDLLREWCVEHGEDYVTMSVLRNPWGDLSGMANIRPESDRYEELQYYKEYGR